MLKLDLKKIKNLKNKDLDKMINEGYELINKLKDIIKKLEHERDLRCKKL